mgnify:CR=1 FL=1
MSDDLTTLHDDGVLEIEIDQDIDPAQPGTFHVGAAAIVELVRSLSESQGRDDLTAQLDRINEQLRVQAVSVVVIGSPGCGKSGLINALVGAPVVPAGPDHPSVDGGHLTDVGFKQIADALAPLLAKILTLPMPH